MTDAVSTSRRRALTAIAGGAAALAAHPAWADDPRYPSRPVRLLLGFAAGGGSDVVARLIARSLGERLGPPLRLPRLFALLVNPGVAVETAAVFRDLGLLPGQEHAAGASAFALDRPHAASQEAFATALAVSGNDLEAPARAVAPVIGEVLALLAALPGCQLARMSGSGATCFALFDDCRASAAAARMLAGRQPGWWIKPTVLG